MGDKSSEGDRRPPPSLVADTGKYVCGGSETPREGQLLFSDNPSRPGADFDDAGAHEEGRILSITA